MYFRGNDFEEDKVRVFYHGNLFCFVFFFNSHLDTSVLMKGLISKEALVLCHWGNETRNLVSNKLIWVKFPP